MVLFMDRLETEKKLQVTGIGDASCKSNQNTIGGILLMLAAKDLTRVSLIYWKSKQIDRVCHFSKDAETFLMSRLLDDARYAARQFQTLLYEDYKKRIPLKMFTDS